MEIERKWLIDGYPEDLGEQLTLLTSADVWQGYISTDPTVRIREVRENAKSSYILCFKGNGTLSKEEIETSIDKELFEKLKTFTGEDLLHKAWRVYLLESGEKLEVSLVDEGREHAFYYAEVEFESEKAANRFTPPSFLGKEKTDDNDFSMSKLWRKTRK